MIEKQLLLYIRKIVNKTTQSIQIKKNLNRLSEKRTHTQIVMRECVYSYTENVKILSLHYTVFAFVTEFMGSYLLLVLYIYPRDTGNIGHLQRIPLYLEKQLSYDWVSLFHFYPFILHIRYGLIFPVKLTKKT